LFSLCAALAFLVLTATYAPAQANVIEGQPAPVSAPAPAIVEPFRIKDEAEFFGLLDLQAPGMSAVKAAAEAKDWQKAKEAWAVHLKNRSNAKWFWTYRDRDTIRRLLAEKKSPLTRFVPSADNALLRKFVFVGVPKTLDKSPEWGQGANEWTSVLNRFHYFGDMGYAYWETGDSKYAADFVFLLKDWIRKNPVPDDVTGFVVFGNTWRALECGLRVQSWLTALQHFMDAPEFDAEAKYEMTRSLAEHARYLRAVDIRRGYRAGNWQVIEATGSAYIGMMLPEFRESAQWRERGFHTLVQHMEKDVNPDGAHYELTPGYHMAVMDQYLQVSVLSQKNGYKVPGLLDRHEKMYDFLLKLCKPDRFQPSVGDTGRQPLERRMADGALLYSRRDMRFFGGAQGSADWVWTFGPDAFDRYAKISPEPPKFTSVLLPDAKYAMMRSGWDRDDSYLLFDMAPWRGGHSHQDRLQVIAYAGRDLLVDPGQYAYDQPLASTYFRTSAAHNVLLINGAEQPDANPTVLAWETTPEADFASGSISAKGLTHQRSVLFLKTGISIIVDHVSAEGPAASAEQEVTRLFHFPPTTLTTEGGIVRTGFSGGKNLQVLSVSPANLEIRKGWVPIAPAKADEAPVAAFITKSTLPQTLVTVLMPYTEAGELPTVEAVPNTDPKVARLRLTYADGSKAEVAVADTVQPLQIGNVAGEGRALVVRTGGRRISSPVLWFRK
ncbi:MAG: alginate lyase family protein, partial [Armatimonadota bacterium]